MNLLTMQHLKTEHNSLLNKMESNHYGNWRNWLEIFIEAFWTPQEMLFIISCLGQILKRVERRIKVQTKDRSVDQNGTKCGCACCYKKIKNSAMNFSYSGNNILRYLNPLKVAWYDAVGSYDTKIDYFLITAGPVEVYSSYHRAISQFYLWGNLLMNDVMIFIHL